MILEFIQIDKNEFVREERTVIHEGTVNLANHMLMNDYQW